jgi:uncharacterized protein with FMN-binding domain
MIQANVAFSSQNNVSTTQQSESKTRSTNAINKSKVVCECSTYDVNDIYKNLIDIGDRLNREPLLGYLYRESFILNAPQSKIQSPQTQQQQQTPPHPQLGSPASKQPQQLNASRILLTGDWNDGISDWQPQHPSDFLGTQLALLKKRANKLEFNDSLGFYLPTPRITQSTSVFSPSNAQYNAALIVSRQNSASTADRRRISSQKTSENLNLNNALQFRALDDDVLRYRQVFEMNTIDSPSSSTNSNNKSSSMNLSQSNLADGSSSSNKHNEEPEQLKNKQQIQKSDSDTSIRSCLNNRFVVYNSLTSQASQASAALSHPVSSQSNNNNHLLRLVNNSESSFIHNGLFDASTLAYNSNIKQTVKMGTNRLTDVNELNKHGNSFFSVNSIGNPRQPQQDQQLIRARNKLKVKDIKAISNAQQQQHKQLIESKSSKLLFEASTLVSNPLLLNASNNVELSLPPIISGKRINLPLGPHR